VEQKRNRGACDKLKGGTEAKYTKATSVNEVNLRETLYEWWDLRLGWPLPRAVRPSVVVILPSGPQGTPWKASVERRQTGEELCDRKEEKEEGTVQEREKERRKERKGGGERERERGHINFTYRLERSVSFLYPASPFSPRSQTEGDRDRAFIPNKRRKKKTVKVQLVLGTTYPKHLKRITKKKYAEKRT